MFTKPLPRNVSWSLHSNSSTRYIAPSFRLFVPNGLQAYHHFFFSKGCASDVCVCYHLPSPWLSSHGDYSPTALADSTLRPLNPSDFLIGCQSVQVYSYHLSFHIMIHKMQTIKFLLLVGAGKLPRVAGAPTSPALTLCAVSSFILERPIPPQCPDIHYPNPE
jgi:hypothetical protein